MPDTGLAWLEVVTNLSFGFFLVAIAVAVLRYRLYDIDRLINRTLVYGVLTALLGAIYAGTVLLLGQAFGGIAAKPPSWAVAAATLAVAALFQPARRRAAGRRQPNHAANDSAFMASASATGSAAWSIAS